MNYVKILSIVTTGVSAVLTIVNAFLDDKKMEEKIDKKYDEREQRNNKEA